MSHQPQPVPTPPSLDLTGKNAIVTGASRGIGAQICLELASRGANIALVYHASVQRARSVAEEVKSLGRRTALIEADLASKDCGDIVVEGAVVGLHAEAEGIDILINCAGADHEPRSARTGFDCGEFSRIMNVNVRAPMLLVQAWLPHLRRPGGRIVNISTTLTHNPDPAVPLSLYASSKSALETLSRHWAAELAIPYRLTSNAIASGIIETHHVEDMTPEARTELEQLPTAEKRLGTVDDLAQVVGFLVSEGARWINGDVVAGCGGSVFI